VTVLGEYMKEIELKISGMTCHHCAMAIRKELARIPGVEVNDVQIGLARLSYDEAKVTEARLRSAVEEAGYTVV
jgi:copper chaperone